MWVGRFFFTIGKGAEQMVIGHHKEIPLRLNESFLRTEGTLGYSENVLQFLLISAHNKNLINSVTR